MSQNQKPGRVRMLAGSSTGAGAAPSQPSNGAPAADVKGTTAGGAVAKGGKRAGLLPVLLFMAGCIGGGVAVARLGPL